MNTWPSLYSECDNEPYVVIYQEDAANDKQNEETKKVCSEGAACAATENNMDWTSSASPGTSVSGNENGKTTETGSKSNGKHGCCAGGHSILISHVPVLPSPCSDDKGEAETSNDDNKVLEKYTKSEKREKLRISSKDKNIQTLGEALKHFGLYPRLMAIERSLEDVRRHRRSREEHESELKLFDKEILKLSQKHHPDRVRNRGGSDEEMEAAKNLQASLNAIRNVLNILSKTFLDNIDVDQMYGFYTNVSISSVGNENEIRDHVYEVFFKISYVSEIRNQNIIPEIRRFLEAGKECLKGFLENEVSDFTKYRDVAMTHLRACITGYIKLTAELEAVEEEVRSKSLKNIFQLIRKMSSGCARDMRILKQVKYVAKESLNGTCRIFNTVEPMDEYFVLPFVQYINVIAMCNTMVAIQNQHVLKTYLRKIQNYLEPDILGIPHVPESDMFTYPYYLASYFSGNEQYEGLLKDAMQGTHTSKEEIKTEFLKCVKQINNYLEDTFKVENYIEGRSRTEFVEDCMQCLKMMAEFEEKEKEVRNGIEKLEDKQRGIEDKLEKVLKKSAEVSSKTKRLLEQDELRPEKTYASLLREIEIAEIEKALKKSAEVSNETKTCFEQDELHKEKRSASLLREIEISEIEKALKKSASEVSDMTKRCLEQDELHKEKRSAPHLREIEIAEIEKALKKNAEVSNETKTCFEQDELHKEKRSAPLLREIELSGIKKALKKSASEVSDVTKRCFEQDELHKEKRSAPHLREIEIEKALKKSAEVSNETKRCFEQDELHKEKRSAPLLSEIEFSGIEKALKKSAEVRNETKKCLEQVKLHRS